MKESLSSLNKVSLIVAKKFKLFVDSARIINIITDNVFTATGACVGMPVDRVVKFFLDRSCFAPGTRRSLLQQISRMGLPHGLRSLTGYENAV